MPDISSECSAASLLSTTNSNIYGVQHLQNTPHCFNCVVLRVNYTSNCTKSSYKTNVLEAVRRRTHHTDATLLRFCKLLKGHPLLFQFGGSEGQLPGVISFRLKIDGPELDFRLSCLFRTRQKLLQIQKARIQRLLLRPKVCYTLRTLSHERRDTLGYVFKNGQNPTDPQDQRL